MGLHHATLKAAVLVYAALIGTMTETALKDEIAKDEKSFTPEEVEEIYAAVVKSTSDATTTKIEDDKKSELNFNGASLVTQEAPAWVAEVLASNMETHKSNQAVIDSIAQFKELAGGLVKEVTEAAKANVKAESIQITGSGYIESNLPVYNPDADYEVIVPFRDSKDFTKLHSIGDDVTQLGEDRIIHLLSTGNVAEA